MPSFCFCPSHTFTYHTITLIWGLSYSSTSVQLLTRTWLFLLVTALSFLFGVNLEFAENTENLKTKMSELRLYCDLLVQQVDKTKEVATSGVADSEVKFCFRDITEMIQKSSARSPAGIYSLNNSWLSWNWLFLRRQNSAQKCMHCTAWKNILSHPQRNLWWIHKNPIIWGIFSFSTKKKESVFLPSLHCLFFF